MPKTLTIVSWNMWCFNKRLDDAFAFIESLNFDILCMQEVPESFLERLKTLPYHLASAIDFRFIADEWHPKKGIESDYLVILSKHPITEQHSVTMPQRPPTTLRHRAFRVIMRYIADWHGGMTHERSTLVATVSINSAELQIICAHLDLRTPQIRAKEFELSTAEHIPGRTIMCGDFNTLDTWYMQPINWLSGGRFRDAMPWHNERKEMEQRFSATGFLNALRGLMTHRISGSQLDHILVPQGAKILEREVIHPAHGSDHNPVRVQVAL